MLADSAGQLLSILWLLLLWLADPAGQLLRLTVTSGQILRLAIASHGGHLSLRFLLLYFGYLLKSLQLV
jgi:hypothetical protein